MSTVTLDELEQQIKQLPLHEQLRLVAHIFERLSVMLTREDEKSLKQQYEEEGTTCGINLDGWKQEFLNLIQRVGELSSSGNSVEDVRRERHR